MLTYDIALERLYGEIGGKKFAIHAMSGGGRGSKVHPYGDPGDKGSNVGLGSWSWPRQEVGSKHIRGGPVPPGFYIIFKPQTYAWLGGGKGAYLEQTLSSLLHADPTKAIGVSVTGRDGFYIHGRGPKGSDGCIVPMEQFSELMTALEAAAPLGLRVVNAGRQVFESESFSATA
jgi:hypothetical protein